MKLKDINHIAIIGTGMIGASMAVLFTGNGYKTTMYAINEMEAARGLENYNSNFRDLVKNQLVTPQQVSTCSGLLNITQKYEDLEDADFIFECVVERISIKHSVYKDIEKYCKKFKAIASSTSAISADDLAQGLIQKEKLAVAHPWNPPHLVPCVEVVKSQFTSDESLKIIKDVLESTGREVVIMKKSAPGFVANRLQHALFREAVNMVEQGYATPEDIDKALRSSFMPRYTSIGLFEHFDYAGLDMIVSIEDYLFPTLSNAVTTQDYIRSRHDAGHLGYKTGNGVYEWSQKDINNFRQRASEPYFKFFNWSLPENKK